MKGASGLLEIPHFGLKYIQLLHLFIMDHGHHHNSSFFIYSCRALTNIILLAFQNSDYLRSIVTLKNKDMMKTLLQTEIPVGLLENKRY